MIYKLQKGFEPGRYTLGEGFVLEVKNEMTERQAAPYVEAGILAPATPSEPVKAAGKTKKKEDS